MRSEHRRPRSGRIRSRAVLTSCCALVTSVVLTLAGCTGGSSTPSPSPSPSATPAPFTVMTTDRIRTADPAAVTDQGSMILIENAFQRLLTSDPGDRFTKPDMARQCIFVSRTSYQCTLPDNLQFHNGDQLTSSDVKFSIERAARLDIPGSSASMFTSLRKIETPDPVTVRFILSSYDTQFQWALASPAASIVDEQVYDPDDLRSNDQPVVGSGPFAVRELSATDVRFARFDQYQGANRAAIATIRVVSAPDSATIESAMKDHKVDVVWRGLSSAALSRLASQISGSGEQRTTDGFSQVSLPGVRIIQLRWNPASKYRTDAALRKVIAGALQDDRTSDSVVPNGVPGHRASFPLGGKSTAKVTWSRRIPLTLGYDASMPDGRDIANQVRSRLEDTGGMTVRLRSDDPDTDLLLEDRKAWTPTAMAWLQPVLNDPLKDSAATISRAAVQARGTDNAATFEAALATLQTQAASDAVVLPMIQRDEVAFTAEGIAISDSSYGPGWQLGLWGMGRG